MNHWLRREGSRNHRDGRRQAHRGRRARVRLLGTSWQGFNRLCSRRLRQKTALDRRRRRRSRAPNDATAPRSPEHHPQAKGERDRTEHHGRFAGAQRLRRGPRGCLLLQLGQFGLGVLGLQAQRLELGRQVVHATTRHRLVGGGLARGSTGGYNAWCRQNASTKKMAPPTRRQCHPLSGLVEPLVAGLVSLGGMIVQASPPLEGLSR